jgi:hypothetical protein
MKIMCQQKPFIGRLHQADLRVERVQMSATVTPRVSDVDTMREERIISGDPRKSAIRGCIPTHLETNSWQRVLAGTHAEMRGPAGAFVEGQESEARQQLFGKIAPVYDQVTGASEMVSPGRLGDTLWIIEGL